MVRKQEAALKFTTVEVSSYELRTQWPQWRGGRKGKQRTCEARDSGVSNTYFIGVEVAWNDRETQQERDIWTVSARLFDESGAATEGQKMLKVSFSGKRVEKEKGVVKDLEEEVER